MARQVTLRSERRADWSDTVWASVNDDGKLSIQGQNLSRGADFLEYEWAFTIPADRVPAVAGALGGNLDDDVLALLAVRYRAPGRLDLRRLLDDAGIAFEFWSRSGD